MMKRLLALLMCLACLTGVLFSCDDTPAEPTDTTPTDTTPATNPSGDDTPSTEAGNADHWYLLGYTIVYPKNASATVKEAAARLRANIASKLNWPVERVHMISDDQTTGTAYSILIGETNREPSKVYYENPDNRAFIVHAVNRTIVLAGSSDERVDQAVQYFEETYLANAEEGKIAAVTDYALKLDPNRVPPADQDFGGYEFIIMTDLQTDYEVQAPEEIGSDGINKALFERNKLVESKYNVKITEKRNLHATVDQANSYLKDMQSSGDYFADLYSNYAIKMISSHATQGYYLNVCDLQSLRLDGEWWDQDFINEFKINNYLYTLTGDIQTNDEIQEILLAMNLSLYNKTYPEKNFYDIVVKNGAWTWQEFYNTWINFGSYDGGTAGKVDSDDKVGYYYDCRTASYFYMASGLNAFSVQNNQPVLTIDSSNALLVMDFLRYITDAHQNLKTVRLDDVNTGGGYEAGNKHFAAGKALFVTGRLDDMITYQQDMQDTVAYVPFPKYAANQDRYYSLVHMCFTPIAISANVRDAERTALITEALCFYSDALDREVEELLLEETADEEVREILQLTLDSKTYDMEYTANIMGWTGLTNDTLFVRGKLSTYKDEMDNLSKQAINVRGTGTLQNFLKAYANMNFN